jgi:hypothetical protein
MQKFESDVLWRQVWVLLRSLDAPETRWRDAHVRQGFAWSKGSVAFGTVLEMCAIDILVSVGPELPDLTECLRAVAVPFDKPEGDSVVISTLLHWFTLDLPDGYYELTCAQWDRSTEEDRVTVMRLHFRPVNETADPRILIRDSELDDVGRFDMEP